MIDIEWLSKQYFWFDKTVPYTVSNGKEIQITPITVEESEIFLSYVDLFNIDKNNLNDPKFISMPYLSFIYYALLGSSNEELSTRAKIQFAGLMKMCLGWETDINLLESERNKIRLIHNDIVVTGKQFEDIRRIILYQNLLGFDDTYIDPDIKQVIDEVDNLRLQDIDMPNLERKMAIISAHTGLSKQSQMKMTYRSHSALFREVAGEVEYSTFRTAGLIGNMFSKKPQEIEDWIYRKKHNKYEKYFTTETKYNTSMGGSGHVRQG